MRLPLAEINACVTICGTMGPWPLALRSGCRPWRAEQVPLPPAVRRDLPDHARRLRVRTPRRAGPGPAAHDTCCARRTSRWPRSAPPSGFSSLGSFSSRFSELVGGTPSAIQARYAASGAPRIPGCWVSWPGSQSAVPAPW